MFLGRAVFVAAVVALASLAVAQPAAAEYATVAVPPPGSTIAIPGPFDEFGGFVGPYFPITWSCSGSWWKLWIESNTNPMGPGYGITDSVRQQFDPTWQAPLLIRGYRDQLPATGTITGRLECEKFDEPFGVLTIPWSTTVTYDVAPTPGVIPPGAPPGTAPTTPSYVAANAAKVRAFKQAKQVLERDRRKMLDAVEELEEQNEVFCSVAGSLSVLRGLHAFQWNGAHVVKHTVLEELDTHSVCEALPTGVKLIFDADRKLDRNRKWIEQLDNQIKSIEGSTGLTAGASAKARGPLAALESQGDQTLAVIDALTTAIGKGAFDDVKRHAQNAATRLAAMSDSCKQVRRYLKKSGLGTRYSRAQILKALRGLSARKLSRPTKSFAKALHVSPAEMKRLIRSAKSVPKTHVKSAALPDLFCNSELDSINKSLSVAVGALAGL
jgi:hypothetical protein